MPHQSHPTASTLVPSEQERYLSRNGNGADRPAIATPDEQDWFYGTEELLDSLPRPWTRALTYALIAMTTVLLPWTMFAKVDETGTAKGQIEPKGATQKLDAAASGEVTQVFVEEGDPVRQGQLLVELDSDLLETDLQQAEAKLEGLLDRRTQMDLMRHQLEMTRRTQQLQNQAQLTEQLAQIDQIQQQLGLHQSTADSIQELLQKDETKADRFRSLEEEGAIAGLQAEDAERSVIETDQRLEESLSNIQQSQAELQKQQSVYEQSLHQGELALLDSERQLQELQTQIAETEADIAQTKSQIQSVKLQLEQREVRSPVDGTVFELPIHKPGSVVQPGKLIAQIAPEGATLVLKAEMASPESGFLQEGMPVKVKFDAYPYQDYGVMEGTVTWISPDSQTQQTLQGNIENFELEIALPHPYIEAGDRRIPLAAGQTATAEVITRQRRVIDFILDPFKRLQQGGLDL